MRHIHRNRTVCICYLQCFYFGGVRMELNFIKYQTRNWLYPGRFTKRRSSLLPREECYPSKEVNKHGNVEQTFVFNCEPDESTALTEISSENQIEIVKIKPERVNAGKMRNEKYDRSQSYESHAMVNRSDSEKLGDVKLHFRSEVHIQNINPSGKNYRSRTKSFEQQLSCKEEMEMLDIPKIPFWGRRRTTDMSMPTSLIAKKRQLLSAIENEAKILTSRRESSSSEERKERMLEILREIVRKCTIPDPLKRPTANELLHILTIKTNILREK